MTREEYDTLCQLKQRSVIKAVELEDQEPRVLIYGYQLNRDTFCLELIEKDGVPFFRRKVTKYPGEIVSDVILSHLQPEHCIPDKRAYPEQCDFKFSLLLQQQGIEIPFTVFS